MSKSVCGTAHAFSKLGVSLILLAGFTGWAQLPTATISGVVRDASGAVIPAATITVRNTETGLSRTSQSEGDGSYRFQALPVGPYEMRVQQAGFRSEVRSGVTLTVSQEAVVNFTLALGAVEQTVAVTAEASLVNTTSGSLGGLVNAQEVSDLPLNGRNYIDLTLLQPGVQQHRSANTGAEVTGVFFSSNGSPLRSNNYLLDGAPMIGFHGHATASATGSTLGVEGIREWRVITNSFGAEYGMMMGSQMIIVSKGGTNTFHGSLLEYFRSSALDARNFFDYKTSTTPRRLPTFTRNNFGASFGGPIKKDHTFLFGAFEGVRQRLGATSIATVIPASAKVDGGLVPQISPLIKPLLTLYPDPNLPNNQYTAPFTLPGTDNYGQIRLDQTFSSNDTLFGRYTVVDGQQTTLGNPLWPNFVNTRSQYSTLSESHVFSPTLLNTLRFSFSRNRITLTSREGPASPEFSFLPGKPVGLILVGGLSNTGPDRSTPIFDKQNIFTWSDDVFLTRGRHILKFGTLINHFQLYTSSSNAARGVLTFPDVTTFLLAQPSLVVGITPGSILDRTYHYTTFGWYVQDDLRVRSNLTLNLGLRYEFYTQIREVHGNEAALRDVRNDANFTIGPLFQNPSLRNISPRFGFSWDVKGDGKTAVRGGFGLLYDIANIGSSLYLLSVAMPPFSSQSSLQTPPAITLTFPLTFPPSAAGRAPRAIDYSLQQPHMLQYNLTMERELLPTMVLTLAYAGSRGINLLQSRDGNPTIPQVLPDGRQFRTGADPRVNPNWDNISMTTASGNSWYNSMQLGLMKRLSNGLQFQSSYTWSKLIDDTQSQLISDRAGLPADSIHRNFDRGLAAFDAAHNLHFNAIYRFPQNVSGRSLGKILNGWWAGGILALQSGYAFDLTMSNDRARVRAGTLNANRPDLVLGRNNSNITHGTSTGCLGVPEGTQIGAPNLYYDPCAFRIPQAGVLGTSGRGILRGPGLANLDLSLAKDTPLPIFGETGKLEFRAEFFNILNRANFATPGIGGGGGNSAAAVFAGRSDVEAPLGSAGRPINTITTSRQIQLALKVVF